MKILIVVAIIFASFDIKAQGIEYDTCQYLHQFEGEWRYTNGNDTIRIYLRQARMLDSRPSGLEVVQDFLLGWHEYKHGNTIVESNYQNRFISLPYKDTLTSKSFSVRIGTKPDSCNSSNRILVGNITDYSQANEAHNVRVILSTTGTMMTWMLQHKEGYGAFTGAYGMTLPKEFILIKQ